MEIVKYILIVIGTFLFMEFVAWATHKYIMHGPLWVLHRDHHQREPGFFEKNDAFFVIFALPSIILFALGFSNENYYLVSLGIGIMLYGAAYFFIHDLFIHQRVKVLRNTKNKYLRAIRKAHRVHHRKVNKEDGECFGMLIAPPKFFEE